MKNLTRHVVGPLALVVLVSVSACADLDDDPPDLADEVDPLAVRDASLRPGRRLAVGVDHTCAIAPSGAVYCWGSDRYGQLGNDAALIDSLAPVPVTGITGATALAAGNHHTCAIGGDGRVRCWGRARLTGDGASVDRPTPVLVPSIYGARALAAGSHHSCAIGWDDTAWCWGNNLKGQLGDGTTAGDVDYWVGSDHYVYATTPRRVVAGAGGGTLTDVVDLGLGPVHSCATLADGTARCWGWNDSAQLGDGTTTDRPYPVVVGGMGGPGDRVAGVSAGGYHSCVRMATGRVRCWGGTADNQLGQILDMPRHFWDDTFGDPDGPDEPVDLGSVEDLSTGMLVSCAVIDSGEVMCWGGVLCYRDSNGVNVCFRSVNSNDLSQGGAAVNRPVWLVPYLTDAVEVAVGGEHVCALRDSGQVRCWGYDDNGELGDGVRRQYVSEPVTAGFTALASQPIAAGYGHTCALLGGRIQCWGGNGYGQLGTGNQSGSLVPVTIAGGGTAPTLTAGNYHTCSLATTGTSRCWGYNGLGGFGNGTSLNFSTVPVVGTGPLTGVSAGAYHGCGIRVEGNFEQERQGAVSCWGYNAYGQLGNGTFTTTASPVGVLGLPEPAVSLATGSYHSCAALADGTVWCWGDNGYKQLGNATSTRSSAPVRVNGLGGRRAVSVVAGNYHTCALVSDGGVFCWGSNGYGQLGAYRTESMLADPAWAWGLYGVNTLAAGAYHTCATRWDGTTWCWGSNGSGQLGTGSTTSTNFPVPVVGLTGARGLALGAYHSCAVRGDGGVSCWGWNGYGQLGDGTTANRLQPTAVAGG